LQAPGAVRIEATAHQACRVAADDGIRRHVGRHHRTRCDDGTVADGHPRHDQGIVADPDIVADHGIALVGQFALGRPRGFPAIPENEEGEGRDPIHLVIGAVHDEFDAARNRTKLPDDQPVANKRKVVDHVLLEIVDGVRIVVIGVIANLNVRSADGILQEAYLRHTRYRLKGVRTGSLHWPGILHMVLVH